MMKKIKLIAVIFLLSACQQLTEVDKIKSKISKIANDENCGVNFKDVSSKASKKLIISYDCVLKDEFFPGKLILNIYQSLSKENIYRDLYIIKDQTYSLKDLQQIDQKSKVFSQHFKLLENSRKQEIINLINPEMRTGISGLEWFNNLFDNMKENKKDWVRDGHIIVSDQGKTYLSFGNKIDNEVIIYITYILSENNKDNQIYGIGVIPLK